MTEESKEEFIKIDQKWEGLTYTWYKKLGPLKKFVGHSEPNEKASLQPTVPSIRYDTTQESSESQGPTRA